MNILDKIIEQKKVETYSDFLTDLDMNPLTGYLARVINEESVKQSLKSLLLTQRTERFFQPWIGSKLNGMLFELNGPVLNMNLENEIKMTIENCEPRVAVVKIVISNGQDFDENNIYVTVVFSINNIPHQTFDFDFTLNRIR